jgi:hypothetical protein
MEGRVQLGGAVRRRPEGVELNVEVTVVADRLGQRGGADDRVDIVDRSASTARGSIRSKAARVSGPTLAGSCRKRS